MVSLAEAELGNPAAGRGVEGKSRAPEQELLSWLGTCLRWELGAAPHLSNGLSDFSVVELCHRSEERVFLPLGGISAPRAVPGPRLGA